MSKKYIALTFDDGPSADITPALLDIIEKYSITASFFVCGQSVTGETAPIMRRAFDMGCEINNHSNTHPAYTELTEEQMKAETDITDDIVRRVIGICPRFFRPPFISVDERVMNTVSKPFICGIGTEDWDDSCTAERRFNDIMAQVCDGIIILMHDMTGNTANIEVVGRLIPELLSQGYTFVTVSQLFEIKGVVPEEHRAVYSIVPQEEMMYREKWFVSEGENE